MKEIDKKYNIKRYSERYCKYGFSPLSLGWGEASKQHIRFEAIYGVGIEENDSVLDIGCGFADLYKFLKKKQWNGDYIGVDLVDKLLKEAAVQNPNIDLRNIDIVEDEFDEQCDWVVSSGIFNAKLKSESNYSYTKCMIKKMYEICKMGIAVDFLSTYVDFQRGINFHSDPSVIFKIAKDLSKKVVLRHDYLSFEFMIYIYKN